MDTTTEVKQPRRMAHPVRVYRTSQLLSQDALSKAAGVARSTIIRIEGGDEPSLRIANAIANVLGISTEALFPPGTSDS